MRVSMIAAAGFMALAAMPAAAQTPNNPYVARGTEPFWALTIDGRTMRFEAPGRRTVTVAAPRPIHGFAGEIWQTPRIRVNTNHVRCTDGMSDRAYRDTVTVTVDRRTYKGCGGEQVSNGPGHQQSMLEGEWRITAINGRSVARGTSPDVSFRNGQMSGNSSCNRFSGSFDMRRGQLDAGQLASTRMACANRHANAQEANILRIFGQRLSVSSNRNGTVVLSGRRGESLTLVRERRR